MRARLLASIKLDDAANRTRASGTVCQYLRPHGTTSRSRGDLQPELFDRDLSQAELLDLPGYGHRELICEAHVAGHLVMRDRAFAELADVLLADLRALA